MALGPLGLVPPPVVCSGLVGQSSVSTASCPSSESSLTCVGKADAVPVKWGPPPSFVPAGGPMLRSLLRVSCVLGTWLGGG